MRRIAAFAGMTISLLKPSACLRRSFRDNLKSDVAVKYPADDRGFAHNLLIRGDRSAIFRADLQVVLRAIGFIAGRFEQFATVDITRRLSLARITEASGIIGDRVNGMSHRPIETDREMHGFSCDDVVHESCSQLIVQLFRNSELYYQMVKNLTNGFTYPIFFVQICHFFAIQPTASPPYEPPFSKMAPRF